MSGLTVSVDYADYLEQTLPRWAGHFDRLVVVTTARDAQTRALCARTDVESHTTDAFYKPGAVFNKSGALDEGVAVLDPAEWLLVFDADILPPEGWREQLDHASLSPGHLYYVPRQDHHGQTLPDPARIELAGFFILFHMSDPVLRTRPLFGDWHNASGYDTVFSQRWRPDKWRRLPFTVTHLGDTRRHWCGRDNAAGMREIAERREQLRSFRHERLG